MSWALTLLGAWGCAAPPEAAQLAQLQPASLVQVGEAVEGPVGGDAVPRRTLAFRSAAGEMEPIGLEARSFVPRWRDGAALVDVRGRLYEVAPGGHQRMLAADATGSLAVSADGSLLAFVTAPDHLGALQVHDGERAQTLASGLASAGVLRFSEGRDALYFVGGRPGGVAGLWRATLDGSDARCLSNCELRTGQPWGDRFVPPPTRAEDLREGPDHVEWTDPDGAVHRVSR